MGDPEESLNEKSEGSDEAETMARLKEEISNLPVSEHLAYMLHSLSALAADRLGLTGDAGPARDLDQARLAIDAFKALSGVLETVRPTGEIAAYRGMLSQLQMAYVGASGQPPSSRPAGEAPAAGEVRAEEGPAKTKKAAGVEAETAGSKSAASKAPKKKRPPSRGGTTGARTTAATSKTAAKKASAAGGKGRKTGGGRPSGS